jgi:hypothetical protein
MDVQCPMDRDAYYLYKSRVAMLLIAIIGARGRFTFASVGASGCVGAAAVWNRSRLKTEDVMENGLLQTPSNVLQATIHGSVVKSYLAFCEAIHCR